MTTHEADDPFLEPRFLESEAYVARAMRRLMEVLGPYVIRRISGTELYRSKRKYLHKFGSRVFDAMTFLRVMVPSEDEIKRTPRAAEHWDTFFYDLGKDAKERTERIIAFRNQSWIHPNSYDDKQVYACLDDILGLLLAVRRAQEADPAMEDVLQDNEAGIGQVRVMLSELGSLLAVGDVSAEFSREKRDALLNPPSAALMRHGKGNELCGSGSVDVLATELAGARLELRVSLTDGSSYEYRKGQANAMVEQARLAIARGAFDVAVASYRAVGTFYHEGQYNREHATALHGRGKIHAKNRRYDQAMADFAAGQQLDPDLKLDHEDAAPYHHKANEKFFAEEYDETIGLFTLVLSLNPDGAAGYSVMRSTRRSTGGSGSYGGRFDSGRVWELYHDRGRAHIALGNYKAAIDDFEQSDRCRKTPHEANELSRRIARCFITLRINPDDVSAHVDRARAYIDSKEYDQALADLDRAGQLDETLGCSLDYWEIFVSRADDSLVEGQAIQDLEGDDIAGHHYFEKAVADYTKALEIDSNNATVLHDRGVANFAVGRYGLAVADHTAALGVFPDSEGNYMDAWDQSYVFDAEECLLDRGRALVALAAGTGDSNQAVLDQAIQDFQGVLSGELLEGWPDCTFYDEIEMGVDVHTELANAYLMQGNVDMAFDIYNQVIAKLPDADNWDGLWESRGNALFRKKEYAAAIGDLSKVLDLTPGYFKLYLLKTRGQAHAALGNFQHAVSDYDAYLEEFVRDQEVLGLREIAVRLLEAEENSKEASLMGSSNPQA